MCSLEVVRCLENSLSSFRMVAISRNDLQAIPADVVDPKGSDIPTDFRALTLFAQKEHF